MAYYGGLTTRHSELYFQELIPLPQDSGEVASDGTRTPSVHVRFTLETVMNVALHLNSIKVLCLKVVAATTEFSQSALMTAGTVQAVKKVRI